MEGTALELYNKAVAAYDRGAYEIAIQEYEKALAIEPENVSGFQAGIRSFAE